MPYDHERANPFGHSPIVEDPFVLKRLKTFSSKKFSEENDTLQLIPVREVDELKEEDKYSIHHVVAIDGSVLPLSLSTPRIEVGFVKIGVVLEKLSKLQAVLGVKEFVDAEELESFYRTYSVEAIVPGRGLVDRATKQSSKDKLRLEIFETLKNLEIDPEGLFKAEIPQKTLLEVLMDLRSHRKKNEVVCPNCKGSRVKVMKVPVKCSECFTIVYYSDLLGLHEKFDEEGNNSGTFSEVMSTFERLIMAGLMMKAERSGAAFKHTAFITDGPLALFISQELAQDLLSFYQRLAGPVLFGLEKTGRLVEFAEIKDVKDHLRPGAVAMVTNEALQKIMGSGKRKFYGDTTFYGRRFLYRTSDGEKIFALSTPPVVGAPYGEDEADNWDYYPHLKAICTALERDQTDMFGVNTAAISAVAKANSTASLPQKMGTDIFTELLLEQDL